MIIGTQEATRIGQDAQANLATYFSLEIPSVNSPLHCWAPYLAFTATCHPTEARNTSIQRRQVQSFRREVILSKAWTPDSVETFSPDEATTIASLKGISDSSSAVVELFNNSDLLGETQIRRLTQLLDALALYDVADLVISKYSNRSALLKATWVLSANFRTYGEGLQLLSIARELLLELPREPSFFGIRFAIFNMLVVASGQRKLKDWLVSLDEIGPMILQDICSMDLSDYHRALHISKYYRATSYVPFVLKDQSELMRRRELIYDNAYAANPRDSIEERIAKENFLPVFETCAKIDNYLGNNLSALQLLSRIPNEVDPYDVKGWMQLGDFQRSLGLTSDAFESYQRGVICGGPHMHILHFKIGQAYENICEFDCAREHYKTSLFLEPSGFSAFSNLFRASESAAIVDVAEILQYCTTYLDDERLTVSQRARANEIYQKVRGQLA